jgi:hypothetical protein
VEKGTIRLAVIALGSKFCTIREMLSWISCCDSILFDDLKQWNDRKRVMPYEKESSIR